MESLVKTSTDPCLSYGAEGLRERREKKAEKKERKGKKGRETIVSNTMRHLESGCRSSWLL